MTWSKLELENMLALLNNYYLKGNYQFDISYGGYRLTSDKGSHTITKNKRYTKQGIGQFLSDVLELIEWENRH